MTGSTRSVPPFVYQGGGRLSTAPEAGPDGDRVASHLGRPPKLTPHQRREAIKRRDCGGESLAEIGHSYIRLVPLRSASDRCSHRRTDAKVHLPATAVAP